jgi:hypothetical protein
MSVVVSRLLGYRDPAEGYLFPRAPTVFRPTPAPGFFRSRVHPLVSFSSSSEYGLASNLPDAATRARRNAFPGVLSLLSDVRGASPLTGGTPTSCLRSALSVSHALDGLLLTARCGLVSSRYHFRDSLYRGFPRCSAVPDSSPGRALLPFCCAPLTAVHAQLLQVLQAGLQSFVPSTDPLRSTAVLPTANLRSPLELSAPSGIEPNIVRRPSPPLRSRPWSPPPRRDDCD